MKLEDIMLTEISQLQKDKINIQKSVMILYAKNELSEKEIRKRIIIIGALKTIKYLGQFLNFSQLQFLHL